MFLVIFIFIFGFKDVISTNNSTILKVSNKLYLIDNNNVGHLFPNHETFMLMGFDRDTIVKQLPSLYPNITVGEPLQALIPDNYENPRSLCPCDSSNKVIKSLQSKHKWELSTVCLLDSPYQDNILENLREIFTFQNNSITVKKVGSLDNKIVENCSIIIEIHSADSKKSFVSAVTESQCPGICLPQPRLLLPYPFTKLLSLSPDAPITCTLTRHVVLEYANKNGSHRNIITRAHQLIRSMSIRRLQECREKDLWPSLQLSKHRKHEKPFVNTEAPLTPVAGLVIWIGSQSRTDLGKEQMQVLPFNRIISSTSAYAQNTNQNNKTSLYMRSSIVGWLATDQEYPCRRGSTICPIYFKPAYPKGPYQRMNDVNPGWACAQRRPMRALSHLLRLFDPGFVLIIDDDSYVDATHLMLGSPLRQYIDTVMSKTNSFISGDMNHKGFLTKKGMLLGGAGYLIGKSALNVLTSNSVNSPKEFVNNTIMDKSFIESLDLLKSALNETQTHCTVNQSKCLIDHSYNNKTSNILDRKATFSVNLMELCVNMLSEENTCYHSDHAMTRCLIYGSYSTFIPATCHANISLPQFFSDDINVTIGMCQDRGMPCVQGYQFACHHYKPNNDLKPVSLL